MTVEIVILGLCVLINPRGDRHFHTSKTATFSSPPAVAIPAAKDHTVFLGWYTSDVTLKGYDDQSSPEIATVSMPPGELFLIPDYSGRRLARDISQIITFTKLSKRASDDLVWNESFVPPDGILPADHDLALYWRLGQGGLKVATTTAAKWHLKTKGATDYPSGNGDHYGTSATYYFDVPHDSELTLVVAGPKLTSFTFTRANSSKPLRLYLGNANPKYLREEVRFVTPQASAVSLTPVGEKVAEHFGAYYSLVTNGPPPDGQRLPHAKNDFRDTANVHVGYCGPEQIP